MLSFFLFPIFHIPTTMPHYSPAVCLSFTGLPWGWIRQKWSKLIAFSNTQPVNVDVCVCVVHEGAREHVCAQPMAGPTDVSQVFLMWSQWEFTQWLSDCWLICYHTSFGLGKGFGRSYIVKVLLNGFFLLGGVCCVGHFSFCINWY